MKYALDFARAERISAGSVRAERSRGTYFTSPSRGEGVQVFLLSEALRDSLGPLVLELDAGHFSTEFERRRGYGAGSRERIDDQLPRPAPRAHQRLEHPERLVIRMAAPRRGFTVIVVPGDRGPGQGRASS